MAISKRRFASFPRESELPVRVSLTRHAGTLLFGLLAKCLPVFLLVFLAAPPLASAADPLGATLHGDGTTTFRVWAPSRRRRRGQN